MLYYCLTLKISDTLKPILTISFPIKKEKLALIYVPTGQMVADVLTKPLSYEAFARHSSYMKGAISLRWKRRRSALVSSKFQVQKKKDKQRTEH